jgi:hypothetical protein
MCAHTEVETQFCEGRRIFSRRTALEPCHYPGSSRAFALAPASSTQQWFLSPIGGEISLAFEEKDH